MPAGERIAVHNDRAANSAQRNIALYLIKTLQIFIEGPVGFSAEKINIYQFSLLSISRSIHNIAG